MTGRPTTITTCTGAGCRRRIMWCVTLNGRRMPLDPEPAADGNVVVTMLPDGTIRGRVLTGRELPAQGPAYVPHWTTCPAADDFRRRQDVTVPRCGGCREPIDEWLQQHGYLRHIGCLPVPRPEVAQVEQVAAPVVHEQGQLFDLTPEEN